MAILLATGAGVFGSTSTRAALPEKFAELEPCASRCQNARMRRSPRRRIGGGRARSPNETIVSAVHVHELDVYLTSRLEEP